MSACIQTTSKYTGWTGSDYRPDQERGDEVLGEEAAQQLLIPCTLACRFCLCKLSFVRCSFQQTAKESLWKTQETSDGRMDDQIVSSIAPRTHSHSTFDLKVAPIPTYRTRAVGEDLPENLEQLNHVKACLHKQENWSYLKLPRLPSGRPTTAVRNVVTLSSQQQKLSRPFSEAGSKNWYGFFYFRYDEKQRIIRNKSAKRTCLHLFSHV